jgi:8-oxo-dGTP pyrophosphatase MutT (NUDIX family)
MMRQRAETMKFREWLQKHRGASIAFYDSNTLLLLHRLDGRWDFPGGHSKQDETPLQTARRESIEECGRCDGEKTGVIITREWHTFLFDVSKQFKCKLSNDEHDDYKWFAFNDVPTGDLLPEIAKIIPELLSHIKSM